MKSRHDDLMLSVLIVTPDTEPRGLVQFAHGMSEHKERYLRVMRLLADHGYASIIHDHRGHGDSVRSMEDLGYFYENGAIGICRDMKQANELIRGRYPDRRLVLVGHSMGSLAARCYAALYGNTLDGLLLSGSPGFNPGIKGGLALIHLMAMVKKGHYRAHSPKIDELVTGAFAKRFADEGKSAWLSANKENVAAFDADPLCGFPFTLNGYRGLLTLMNGAYSTWKKMRWDLPVCFMSGEDDPCAPDRAGFDAAVENIRKRGPRSVEAKMYPGLRHEIFNELSDEVDRDLLAFIESICG